MKSDPCRKDLPKGVNTLRKKAVENLLENSISGSSVSQVDKERVSELVGKWESRSDLDKVQGGR